MTEAQYLEVPCTRGVMGTAFTQGVQDFPFSIGVPNAWYPKKSYFKVTMSLYAGAGQLPLLPSALTAYADNAVGNLYDNAYFRGGEQDISSLTQYCSQASAIKTRINNTLPWLRSMGAGTAINESSFQKRLLAVTQYPSSSAGTAPTVLQASATGEGSYDEREVYRPFLAAAAGNFAAASVTISVAGVVTGVNTSFLIGMPVVGANGLISQTGGSVLPGDLLVVNGVPYNIYFDATPAAVSATNCTVSPAPRAVVGVTTNWFIVRTDVARSPQGFNTVFGIWQPPLGIFDYGEEMGAGNYRLQLNPNSSYQLNAVETKDPNFLALSPYNLFITDVKFYAYVEKKIIPDASRTIDIRELSIQSKTWSSNLQFSVPPSTEAISIFVQDAASGQSPLVPPSMFKVLDNGDLYLQNIQVSYASITKPSTNWASNLILSQTNAAGAIQNSSTLELQQRYHDTYEESGLEVGLGGQETLTDWLRRGPYYHFTFYRDVNNKSTEVQINTTYNPQSASFGGASPPRLFIVAWYRKAVQITTANGLIVSIASREV